MKNAAVTHLEDRREAPRAAYRLTDGRVLEVRDEGLRIEIGGERREGVRAAGCLLAPIPGDRVLVADQEGEGPAFVLTVLAREGGSDGEEAPSYLSGPGAGDLVLGAPGGRVSVLASEGIDLHTPGEITMEGGHLRASAEEGSFSFEKATYLGGKLLAELRELGVAGERVSSAWERIHEKADRIYRFVRGEEQLRAKSIDHRATDNMTMRAKNTLLSAEELAKVDASQIHIG